MIMDEVLKIITNQIKPTFNICNEAISEIWYLTQTPSTKEEKDIALNHTLHFYGAVLQYCFIMEYTKLLEKNDKSNKTNIASIDKLNTKLSQANGSTFENKYEENNQILIEIVNSALYIKIRELRDKKFVHADNSSINDPLRIKGFTGEEMNEIFYHLNLILKVINNCIGVFGESYMPRIPHYDDRTANFVRYHAVYKKFYHDNLSEANIKGYILR
jgi:hypothetical protein